MEMLTQIQDDELQELNGGGILVVLEAVGIVYGMYLGLRDIVKDAGQRAAYRDLGM